MAADRVKLVISSLGLPSILLFISCSCVKNR